MSSVAEHPASWVVVVPVKRLDRAKTRLSARPAVARRRLALAFTVDTVAAVLASPHVAAVLVVADDDEVRTAVAALGATCVPDEPDAGLNPAVEHGVRRARDLHPGAGVAVLAGDLPAVRTHEIELALAAAGAHPRSFVADASGTGTTMLLALPGAELVPRFGPRSRAAHAADSVVALDLSNVPGLRRDVDTEVDLWDAERLGVGAATATALGLSD